MNLEELDTRIKEKLEPHLKALADGSISEYDILPAILSRIIDQQSLLIKNQTGFCDLTYHKFDELKTTQSTSNRSIVDISDSINSLIVKQQDYSESKFEEAKIIQDTNNRETIGLLCSIDKSINKVIEQQNILESSVLKNQLENLSLRKLVLFNLAISTVAALTLIVSLILFLK